MSSISASLITSNQPQVGGVSFLVTVHAAGSAIPVSFNYIVFPGQNINSTGSTGSPYYNSVINKTANVGSSNCFLLNTSGNTYTYSLTFETNTLLPNYDYDTVISGNMSDGTQTSYTQALLTPICAQPITITQALITHDTATYNTKATIQVFFTQPVASTGTFTYSLAIQYIDGNGNTQFTVIPNLTYNSGSGSVTTVLDASAYAGVEEAWVAIQSVRSVGGAFATSQLSNTVAAVDKDVPVPPNNLTSTYTYNTEPQTNILSWFASPQSVYQNVQYFKVYRSVQLPGQQPSAYSPIASVNFNPSQPISTAYTYTDTAISDNSTTNPPFQTYPIGTNIFYYVTAVNANTESAASNIAEITITTASTAPVALDFAGITFFGQTSNNADIDINFFNPTTINGLTHYGYNLAYFHVQVYQHFVGTTTQNLIFDSDTAQGFSQILYVAGQTTAYNVPVNKNYLTFASDAGISAPSTYNAVVKVNLITYQTNGNILLGNVASVEKQIGPLPIIINVNNTATTSPDSWTKDQPLTNFQIVSATTLTQGNSLTTIALAGTNSGNVSTYPLGSSNWTVSLITNPYSPFYNAYLYNVTSNLPDQSASGVRVTTITAANSAGVDQRNISGQVL
jgi:hypothetical protein